MKFRNIKGFFPIVYFFFIIVNVGCTKDFLNRNPESNMSTGNFYKSKEDFVLALNAAYSQLYTIYDPLSAMSFCGEQMSDNATIYNIAGNQSEQTAFKDYSLMANNSVVYRFWQEAYKAIFQTNIVISNIQAADLDESFKMQAESEMKFLRALFYFNTVRMFGGVPLVTTPVTELESYGYGRASEEDVYKQIVSDLVFAEENIQEDAPAVGRATKGAVDALLGKVYLTLGDKQNATTYLMRIYNTYSLLSNYKSLWDVSYKNSSESIFEIQYLGGASVPSSRYWPIFAPFENLTIVANGGGMNQVTETLWNEFEPNDVRKDASIFQGYTNRVGKFIEIKFPKKWVDSTAQVINEEEACSNNFIVLRYADVLLMLAESTGDAKYLNEVRARVSLPLYGSASYPSQKYGTLELAIEHERRVELALEFHRWFDLKRTGRAIAVLQANGKNVTNDKLLLPIPQVVVDQNSIITQNPGY